MASAKDLKELSNSLSILYAEDEEMLRDSMQSTLGKLFKNVYIAKNGQEAISIFKKEKIDLILTDINMPIMSGIEFIAEVNKIENNPIIIVLSAHDESRLLKTLINMEVNNFLNKPVEKDALIKILYKNCSIINDKKLVKNYAQILEKENDDMRRLNIVLEIKLKQLASQTNKLNKKNKPSKESSKETKDVSYFETLLQDDKDELKDLSEELETNIMLMFQNENLNIGYIEKLSYIYSKYASVLNAYVEFYNISNILSSFANVIITLEDKFLDDVKQTGIYFESLQLTLESFRKGTWEKEANDPKFYNASLHNDIQMIIDYLEENEVEENEVEFF